MTEPENFDDELFADLYNDDEPAKPATASVTDQQAAIRSIAESNDYRAADTSQTQTLNGADNPPENNDDDDGEEEDDDDDIDFNLGDGPSTTITTHASNDYKEEKPAQAAPPVPAAPSKGPNAKEDGKMFIGGLNWETTDESLRNYFSQFGEVVECTVMRDSATGRSRGFGFLTFKDPKVVNIVMVKEHYLDGKIIDPKRAIPRDEQEKTSKIFVGGVSPETTDHEFREYFSQFGRVVDATLMMDKDTGRPRGFGFVTFESEAGVEACLNAKLELHGKPIEVKKAQPRGNLRDDEDARRGKFGRKGQGIGGIDDALNTGMGGMAGMSAAAGMTPQLMAQYIARMQQAFAMMQQQMMMNRNMNPAMMQWMQMQQMMAAQAGRGGPGMNPMMGGMNPAMMQQMQQMMNQQAGGPGPMPQQGGPGGPGGPGGSGPNAGGANQNQSQGPSGPGGSSSGGPNRPGGYNGYEQQQQYDQQQPSQQQQGLPPRRGGGRDMHGGYNQGYGPMGPGGPTSWEGMYDDVPQPVMNQPPGPAGGGYGRGGGFHHKGNRGHHQMGGPPMMGPVDPNNAPPANAPTGPKNAGKPGANYRGGGRGGNRGFHPYARN